MKTKTQDDWIVEGAEAHTDLCLFDTIVSMVEGGGFSSMSHVEQFNVISVCRRGMAKSLARYDRARRKVGGKSLDR